MPLLYDLKVSLMIAQGVCGCDRFSSSSIGDVIQSIVRKDGYRGLVRGWIPRILFHAPAAAICWSTYEASKTLFQQLSGTNSSV
jgi:solute carrier family 25 iron transporter 28/37